MPDLCHYLGLDLGQVNDPSALCALERPRVLPSEPRARHRPVYRLRALKRWPLGTGYPKIVADVVAVLRAEPFPGSWLGVDQTGVGRPVVDMLADGLRGRARCRMLPVTITAGHQVTVSSGLNIPKVELVGVVQTLLGSRRLLIAESLPEAPVLVKELENFRVKVNVATAHESFEAWRERDHDDLVLALAIAAWLGEKELPRPIDRGAGR